MNLKDCYQRLELPPTASESEIRQAYKSLVKRWHPDKFEADSPMKAYAEERIKIINSAYDLIRRHQSSNGTNAPSPNPPHSAREYRRTASSAHAFQNIAELKKKLRDTIKETAAALKGIFFSLDHRPRNFAETGKTDKNQTTGKKPFKRVLRDLKGNIPREIITGKLKYNGFKSIYHLRCSYGPRRTKGGGPIAGVAPVEKNQSVRPINKISPIGKVKR